MSDSTTLATPPVITDGSSMSTYDQWVSAYNNAGMMGMTTGSTEGYNPDPSNTVTNPDGSTSTTVGSSTFTTPASSLADVFVGSLITGFKWIGNLFFTKGIILAALLFFVDWVVNFFLELVAGVLKMGDLTKMISELPSLDFLKYIFHLTALDYGLPLLLAASLLKFFIRRLPVVG